MVHLTKLTKQHGAHILYQDASMRIGKNEKIGLVGPNGAGKTTIFRLITKQERPDMGDVTVADRVIVGYFSQDVSEMRGRTVLAEVVAGAGKVSELGEELAKYEQKLQEPMGDDEMARVLEKYGEAQLQFEQLGGYDVETRAKEILGGLGFHKNEFDKPVETFSGGWMMRVALAKILCLRPDVLLMDEPTNHLDVESIVWLEAWLKDFKGSILMTSHDRDFMNRLVSKIISVENKRIESYTGNYDFYEKQRAIKLEQLKSEAQKQQDMMARSQEFIDRFAARASHAAQVQSRVKMLEKLDIVEVPPEERSIDFEFPKAPRSGNDVVKFEGLAKKYGDKPVFSGVSGVVRRLDKIAVVGINGAGKSTLLKIVTGQTEGTAGKCEVGASVAMGYFSQHALDILDPRSTPYEEVFARVPNSTIGYVRNLLGAFLFSGDDVHKKISVLSGGEKSRVVLACILANPNNLLILDEPTNHLDIKSREMLLKALKNFEGTVMLVSHDRHFLREVSNRVFEVDHGALNVYEGNYEYYIQKRGYLQREP
ncbi:MAG: ABC-F family ATP-binding cassette domain-containing protein [Deltaproteobacteria bacterium]|nr:ABC-F family ATP-binding cassette domain-containing protein [Deltaproteobacteria bacterium]